MADLKQIQVGDTTYNIEPYTNYLPLTGGSITGELKLYATSGDSPRLTFQRGELTDTYNDWSIYDSGGYLYLQQRGSGSTAWETRGIFYTYGVDFAGTIYEDGTSLSNKYVTIGTDQSISGYKKISSIGIDTINGATLGNAIMRQNPSTGDVILGSTVRPLRLWGNGDRPTYSKDDGSSYKNLALLSDLDSKLNDYGSDTSRPGGTSFTFPGGSNPVQMRSGNKSAGRDIGIFSLTDDNAFICNSSDNGYAFAVFDTDKTADFSTASNAAFAVLSEHAGVSIKGGLSVDGTLGFKSNYLVKPVAEFRTQDNTFTGAIAIALPAGISNTMVSMWIDVYNYSTNTSFSVHVGGYTYENNTWQHNPFAMVYGANHTVRLGHNGTNFVIYIGETNSTWNYPQISVRDVILGFRPDYNNWKKDWGISFVTSFSNVSATINNYAWTTKNFTPPTSLPANGGNADYANSAGDADTLDGDHSSAFARVGAHNDLTASGNEFTFASSGYSGPIYLNWRTAGGTNGNITEYILGNGAGAQLGTIIHSGNIGSQNVNYANSAGSVAWENVSGRPSSLPASDVYDWAKASSKPSYTASEVGAATSGHTHDDRYYTKSEMNTKLNEKSDTGHTHSYLPLGGGALTGTLNLQNSSAGISFTRDWYITNIETGSVDVNIGTASVGYTTSITATFKNYNKGLGSWYVVATVRGDSPAQPECVVAGIGDVNSNGIKIRVRKIANNSSGANPTWKINWIAIKYH